jgi:hypothetical protein
MNLGSFIGWLMMLIALLAEYWWGLSRLKPRMMRFGHVGSFGLWVGGWFIAILVAGLPTAFVGQANWAFLVGLILAGTMNTWIYGRLAWDIGRSRKSAQVRPDESGKARPA